MKKTVLALITLFLTGCAHSPKAENAKASESIPASAFDPELTNYTYPFPVTFYEFDSQKQKMKMAYMDVAPAKPNGRTVVLLHGKNFSGAYWAPTIRALNNLGYRVIAPDQIGFGKSTKPDSYQFSLQALSQNTNALLKTLGIERATFVGHSMGGMIAIRYTLMFPEQVDKLALVNPIGLEDWKLVAPYRTVDQNYQQELKATPESIKGYQQSVYFDGQWKTEYDSLIEVPTGWLKHPEYKKIAWNSALTTDMVFTQPVIYEFSKIRTPTLLINGLRDKTAIGKAWASKDAQAKMGDYPRLGRAFQKAVRGSRLVEIEGAGHLPQVEKFDSYLKALVEFIR